MTLSVSYHQANRSIV